MICTHHRPVTSTAMPTSTASVSSRRCGSFFFSWSKTIMSPERRGAVGWVWATVSSSAFYFPVGAEAGLPQRPVVEGLPNPIEAPEPDGSHRATDQAHGEPLPERPPADERLAMNVDDDEQGEQRGGGAARGAENELGEGLVAQDEVAAPFHEQAHQEQGQDAHPERIGRERIHPQPAADRD